MWSISHVIPPLLLHGERKCACESIHRLASLLSTLSLNNSLFLAHLTFGIPRAIVVGTALRQHRVYFPWAELVPAAVLHAIFPETMDAVLRAVIYRD